MRDWIRWRLQNPGGLFLSILLFVFAVTVFYFAGKPDLTCPSCRGLSPYLLAGCSALGSGIVLGWQR